MPLDDQEMILKKRNGTDLIITIFCPISGKKSKGTQILPLCLLMKTSYLYPKELPLDTPLNRRPVLPLRCLKGITGREFSSG